MSTSEQTLGLHTTENQERLSQPQPLARPSPCSGLPWTGPRPAESPEPTPRGCRPAPAQVVRQLIPPGLAAILECCRDVRSGHLTRLLREQHRMSGRAVGSAFKVCLVLNESRRQLPADLCPKNRSHESHGERDGCCEPSLHDRSTLTTGSNTERDRATGELTRHDLIDQWTTPGAIECHLLPELQGADGRDLSVMAAGSFVVDDLEDNAAVKARGCVMGHVTELATHQLGVPFDLDGSHHFKNCTYERYNLCINSRVA